jgi:hypothetical protein
MDSRLSGRRLCAVAGLCAVIATGAMSAACAKEEKAPPTSTTTTTTTTTAGTGASPAPGEKSINPTGGNLFTPPVVATPAPNVPPGQHPGLNGTP